MVGPVLDFFGRFFYSFSWLAFLSWPQYRYHHFSLNEAPWQYYCRKRKSSSSVQCHLEMQCSFIIEAEILAKDERIALFMF